MTAEREGFQHKQDVIRDYLQAIAPRTLWDLGANTGVHSRLASRSGIQTVAWDFDPGAVELCYREIVREKEQNLLPLQCDLTNPSAAIGWANEERLSMAERGPADAAMALALIHHLAIGNNVPLPQVAAFFARLTRHLITEFVLKPIPRSRCCWPRGRTSSRDYTQGRV
ncbi:MAG: class I SAM-dependent methyltransferase [Candidatus Eisenbacteria bacterium]